MATLCALSAAAAVAGVEVTRDEETALEEVESAPAPEIFVREVTASEAAALGFPGLATANTTRVGGADPTATAAGVALAVHPSVAGAERTRVVVLADPADWQGAIAAGSLVAEPIGAPILFSGAEEVPEVTSEALERLEPSGAEALDGAQVIAIGGVAAPEGLEVLTIDEPDPASTAARIADLRREIVDEPPANLVVVALDQPAHAMPAAAWAARSGEPVLYVQEAAVPEETLATVRRERRARIYVLGSEETVGNRVARQLDSAGGAVTRVGATGAVESAIAFARFVDGGFGWNITDPGHGLAIANVSRPADAAAAAPLAASGQWGPLLVTDQAAALPGALADYLLDLKPGYIDDPTRAVANHVWVVGDQEAVSVEAQAQIDELAALIRVRRGLGAGFGPGLGPGAEDTLFDELPNRPR